MKQNSQKLNLRMFLGEEEMVMQKEEYLNELLHPENLLQNSQDHEIAVNRIEMFQASPKVSSEHSSPNPIKIRLLSQMKGKKKRAGERSM